MSGERYDNYEPAGLSTEPNVHVELETAKEACATKMLNFLECPTLDNQVLLSNATSAFRDAWIRSKSS